MAIAAALAEMGRSGDLGENLVTSLGEFAVGFGLACIVGIALGWLAGWYRLVEYALYPFVRFL